MVAPELRGVGQQAFWSKLVLFFIAFLTCSAINMLLQPLVELGDLRPVNR